MSLILSSGSALWTHMRRVTQTGLDLIFPQICFGCQESADNPLCPDCLARLKTVSDTAESPIPLIQDFFVLWQYEGLAKTLIQHFKIERGLHLKPVLERFMDKLVKDSLERLSAYTCLVPIPSSGKGRQKRWQPSEEIASLLSAKLHIPVRRALKRRHSARFKQSGLTRNERKWRADEAFEIDPSVPLNTHRVLLVDDITTSGFTAQASARLLLGSGATAVGLFVLGRGLKKS